MIHPPTQRKERVLIYGRSNSGKSSAWLAIASWRADTNAGFDLYVGDTDHAWDAMRPDDNSLDSFCHVTDLDLERYRDWIDWARGVRKAVNPDDWVVVDMIDKAWSGAQGYYWEQKGGIDLLADVYLENQKALDSDGGEGDYMGGAHGANWGIINKYYNAFYQTIINMPCHVLCVAPAAEVRKGGDKPEVVNQFKVGWKPQGQKDLPHGFHSVLFAAETPDGWVYTTVRERGPIGRQGRAKLKGEKVDDFVLTYLMGVGGWKP